MAALLDELWSGRTLVLSHRNADIDALGSSIALALMFPDVTVGAVESISRGARNLERHFASRLEVVVDPRVEDDLSPYDRLVFVDTATPTQVEPYDAFLGSSIVIDHHLRNDALASINPRYHCRPDAASCAQVVHSLAIEAGAEAGPEAALALVAGILADTERFRIAPNEALRDAVRILEQGRIELTDVIAAIERPFYDRSMAIAVLKAAQRSDHRTAGAFILAHSRVGAFEAASARHLVSMGADVALVLGEEGGVTSITGRAGRRAVSAGFHLGELFRALADRTGGDGGGHPGAAGFKAHASIDEVEEEVLALATQTLEGLPEPDD